ncbi:MAG: response regulator [Thaumarchaeota archaeon]|nr:response regulator [Nitrososphaerota archaeon]
MSTSAKRRLLIIDDEDDIREVTKLSLESTTSWEVTTARSGEEGLREAEGGAPDAILLDAMLPGMDGLAIIKELQARVSTRAIPVVFLTAKAQSSDRAVFEKSGARGVITKPFDPMTLAGQIEGLLNWSRGS